MKTPAEPSWQEKALPVWQLYAFAWQAYAERVLGQRITTAACIQQMKQQGVIK